MKIVLRRKIWLEYLFIVSFGIALVHQLDKVIIPNDLKYGVTIIWICVWLLKIRITKTELKLMALYIIPFIVIFIVSTIYILISGPIGWDAVSFGYLLVHSLYGILRCLVVVAIVYIFKERAVLLMFKALVFSGIIIVIYIGMTYGFMDLLNYFFTGVFSAVTNDNVWGSSIWHIGWAMEVHDNTFAFGVFLLYFIFFETDQKFKKYGIIISVFFLYIGMKRIEIIAIIVVLIVAAIMRFVRLNSSVFYRICVVIAIGVSGFMLFLVSYYSYIFIVLDIFRVSLYSFLGDLISVNNLLIGRGWGYANEVLTNNHSKDLLSSSHSDLVRMYIELGAIGFSAWIAYYLFYIPSKLEQILGDKKVGKVVFLCALFMFSTYFIDNTLELFAVQIMFTFLPFGIYHLKKEARE